MTISNDYAAIRAAEEKIAADDKNEALNLINEGGAQIADGSISHL